MNASEFIEKWQQVQLSERSAAQQHFLDLCALVGHPPPAAFDPTGEKFMFERGTAKHGGGEGWADVWKQGFFGWEYKGQKKNLDTAYDQLLQYREALENPPLLVVCDMDRILVHTNFTAVVNQVYEIPLAKMAQDRSLEILEAVFFDPEKLKPGRTSEAITQEAASMFAGIAASLRARGVAPDASAHFLDRVVFCLFAEDIGLLPDDLFSRLIRAAVVRPAGFPEMAGKLFRSMAEGEPFGADLIRHFNGALFEDATALELTRDELRQILTVTALDWSAVDISIFGTLFERSMNPAKRAQLGAHYTSRQDIELLIDPVIMQPLRAEWATIREAVSKRLAAVENSKTKKSALRSARAEGYSMVGTFLQKLAHVKVLDPACGSGNFLYVTLQKLKDLEKEVTLFAMDNGLGAFLPTVGPWQLYGIEINPYAYDLALMTVWIGYLQWVKTNGFGFPNDPILHKLEGNFRKMDAILDLADPAHPKEPEWPRVDFIVSNPPFLGGKMLRRELGDEYMNRLFALWQDRVPHEADLCCYWFEKARAHLEKGGCKRAGLLATQGIRGGANRQVLKRIKETGDIFWAVSDREWILAGANVHVSMVAFDDGTEKSRTFDDHPVERINANLTGVGIDTTRACRLPENLGFAFMGTTKQGPFDIREELAAKWVHEPNPHGKPNSDVIVPWLNGQDVTRRSRGMWVMDLFNRTEAEAMLYTAPFGRVADKVKAMRAATPRDWYRKEWWQLYAQRPEMRKAVAGLARFVVTPTVSKHRLFAWQVTPTNPDHQLIVFARADDHFFGVLHSRLHEVWALALGTQLREKESGFRYTPTTCFETFPFPWAPGTEPADEPRVKAIAEAARDLCELRDRWLNPPEWTRPEVLEFPATCGGPWDRFIVNPRMPAPAAASAVADASPPDSTIWEFAATERNVEAARNLSLAAKPLAPGEVGIARYPRLVPQDAECAKKLEKRTLTALYNQRPEWLQQAHRRLDEAVAAAYGWPADLSDETILAKLLALNAERASPPATQ